MGRGAFIVFEGGDRSGKTTQTRRCVNALSAGGIAVAGGSAWRFPDRTTGIGGMIDGYLRGATELDDRALHLLFSANRWEKAGMLRAALQRGETVVADRYAYSGVAYSAARGLGVEWCKGPDEGLPAPDVVVFLELGVEKARERGGFGGEKFEEEGLQRRVMEMFGGMVDERWRVVDAGGTEDKVFEEVMDAVWEAIKRAKESDEVDTLWG